MKHVVGVVLAALLALAVGEPASVWAASKARTCRALCKAPIKACLAAVPPNETCAAGQTHAACVRELGKERAQCRTTLSDCKKSPHPTTCPAACTDLASLGPCTGMLNGSAAGAFDCSSTFANFNASTKQTRFNLGVKTPPQGATGVNLILNFKGSPVAAPPATQTFTFPTSPPSGDFGSTSNATLLTPSKIFAAGPATGEGTMLLTLSSAHRRSEPTTFGDWCLHGTLDATMPSSGVNPVTLHVDF